MEPIGGGHYCVNRECKRSHNKKIRSVRKMQNRRVNRRKGGK